MVNPNRTAADDDAIIVIGSTVIIALVWLLATIV